mmetsp:Transcript_22966/g.28127  ORF Transcript_22966/g.28127 Transcript_22966/m.28127 type:complete len:361 (-) Transcript_22966:356-1438(-)
MAVISKNQKITKRPCLGSPVQRFKYLSFFLGFLTLIMIIFRIAISPFNIQVEIPDKKQIPPQPEPLPSKPKFSIVQEEVQISSPNTVVTSYFNVKSKHKKGSYDSWMSHFLSLQDAMVIFTSHDLVESIQNLRKHAKNRTVIIPFNLTQSDLVTRFEGVDKFWEKQFDIDPEKKIHGSFNVFWIWLSKSFFVKSAIEMNVFGSDIFMWSDIGCFRNQKYNGAKLISHPETIPKDRILQMAHHPTIPPKYVWWNNKYTEEENFYHSGSQMIGYKDTFLLFHEEFLKTIDGFLERGMFIGEDQTVSQSTCLRVPTLCAYVPSKQVNDNHYFGLRYVVNNGGKYKYWYPPDEGVLPLELSEVK